MTATLTPNERTLFVDAREQRQAHELLRALGGRPERLTIEDKESLPQELAAVISTVVEVMANGGTVTIGALPEELTTTVAAEQLGVSRPTLMKMIKRNDIPAHMVGSHHRLKLADVLQAKRGKLAQQRQAFDRLRELSDQLDEL